MSINNETLGQTAEKVICDLSRLDSSHLKDRSNKAYEEILKPLIIKALKKLPKVNHTIKKGSRGQNKSKIDFILSKNETLSVKLIKVTTLWFVLQR